MGSVIDYIDCPVCGHEAITDFYYKSGEEFISCNNCGYCRRFFIENYDDQRDGTAESPWIPKFKLEEVHGHGAYRLRGKGAVATECGSFVSADSEAEFINLVEREKDNLEHASYTIYREGQAILEVVLLQGKQELQVLTEAPTAEVPAAEYPDFGFGESMSPSTPTPKKKK